MAKFITSVAGNLTEVTALTTSTGAGDAGKIPGLDAAGRLDVSLMPTGLGADTAVITTSEALAAGDFVNIHDASGPKARKASAAAVTTKAHGFVLAGFASGAAATVYFEGTNTGLTGLTAGDVWLSTSTPGGVQSAAPTVAGQVQQRVGVAVSATAVNVGVGPTVTLA
jgi:hypothetical protein